MNLNDFLCQQNAYFMKHKKSSATSNRVFLLPLCSAPRDINLSFLRTQKQPWSWVKLSWANDKKTTRCKIQFLLQRCKIHITSPDLAQFSTSGDFNYFGRNFNWIQMKHCNLRWKRGFIIPLTSHTRFHQAWLILTGEGSPVICLSLPVVLQH